MSHRRTILASGWQFLLFAALSAAVVAGCGSPLTPEQKAAISKVQRMGGKVNVSYGGYEVDLRGSDVSNDELAALKEIKNLKVINLSNTNITDEGLAHLKIPTLRFLKLQRTKTTRDGIKKLQAELPDTDVQR
jgi:hypothetical protein